MRQEKEKGPGLFSRFLGVTAQHPVYSLERGDFVAAGELSAGERLATLAGPTAVLGIQPQHTAGQHTPQTVYNLEVQGQHVFRVTSNGLLVHNSYGNAPNSGPAFKTWNQFQSGTKVQFANRAEAAKAWDAYKQANGIVTGTVRSSAVEKGDRHSFPS